HAPRSRGGDVVLPVYRRHSGGIVRHRRRQSAGIAGRGIVEVHLCRRGRISKRSVALAHVILFVACEPFIEHPGSSAQDGLLASGQIKRKPEARGKSVPVVTNQALRNSVPSGYAYSIHVERHIRQKNTGNRGESRTIRVQSAAWQEGRRLRRVVEVPIEIR